MNLCFITKMIISLLILFQRSVIIDTFFCCLLFFAQLALAKILHTNFYHLLVIYLGAGSKEWVTAAALSILLFSPDITATLVQYWLYVQTKYE